MRAGLVLWLGLVAARPGIAQDRWQLTLNSGTTRWDLRLGRLAGEPDEAQIPPRGAAIEGQLPPVLRDAGPRGDEAEPQDESGPHAGFAPTFSVLCPSLPRLRFRAFSRLRLRALPCVPR